MSPHTKAALENLNLMDEILAQEQSEDKILELIDLNYPATQSTQKWLIQMLKPFLLALFNEPLYDYSTLLPDEVQALEKKASLRRSDSNQIEYTDEIVHMSQESLYKKFEIRLKSLLKCF